MSAKRRRAIYNNYNEIKYNLWTIIVQMLQLQERKNETSKQRLLLILYNIFLSNYTFLNLRTLRSLMIINCTFLSTSSILGSSSLRSLLFCIIKHSPPFHPLGGLSQSGRLFGYPC